MTFESKPSENTSSLPFGNFEGYEVQQNLFSAASRRHRHRTFVVCIDHREYEEVIMNREEIINFSRQIQQHYAEGTVKVFVEVILNVNTVDKVIDWKAPKVKGWHL